MNHEWRRNEIMKLRGDLEKISRVEEASKIRWDGILSQMNQMEEENANFAFEIEKLKRIKDHYKDYVLKIWPVMRDSYHIKLNLTKNAECNLDEAKSTRELFLINQVANSTSLIENESSSQLHVNENTSNTPFPQTSTPKSNKSATKHTTSRTANTEKQIPSTSKPRVELFPQLSKPLEREPQLTTTFQPVLSYTPQLTILEDTQKERVESKIPQNVDSEKISKAESLIPRSAESEKLSKVESLILRSTESEKLSKVESSIPRNTESEKLSKVESSIPRNTESEKLSNNFRRQVENEVKTPQLTKTNEEPIANLKEDLFDKKNTDLHFEESQTNSAYEKLIQNQTKSVMIVEDESSEDDDDVENEMMAVMGSIKPVEQDGDGKNETSMPTQQNVSSPSPDLPKKEKQIESQATTNKSVRKTSLPAYAMNLDSDSDVGIPQMETDNNSDKDDFSFFD